MLEVRRGMDLQRSILLVLGPDIRPVKKHWFCCFEAKVANLKNTGKLQANTNIDPKKKYHPPGIIFI